MKLVDIRHEYLYEGLTVNNKQTMRLWESAGRHLVEANLSAEQISQLFQQVEKGATDAGTNRTFIGKGKDAASAVASAYTDLKTKAVNSQPMKNADALYDQAAEKLKQATGGDKGVMQYVQKYRDFAKKYPKSQSFIYAALIGAAGISGAGVGGAAALGLLKMTDKLLQGEQFSKAAIAGAETGALAYGASQIGQAMKGDTTTTTSTYTQHTTGMQPANPWDIPKQLSAKYPPGQFDIKTDGMDYFEVFNKAGEKVANLDTSMMESVVVAGIVLKEQQIRGLFSRVEKLNNRMISEGRLDEGPLWDKIKSGAKAMVGKAGQKLAQVGKNITTKVTADKLMSAWKAAGSPTDSNAVAQIIKQAGVSDQVISTVFQANNISYSPTQTAQPNVVPMRAGQAIPTQSTIPVANKPLSIVQPTAQATAPAQPTVQTAPAGRSKEEIQNILNMIKNERRMRLMNQNQQAFQTAQQPSKTVKKAPAKKPAKAKTPTKTVAKTPAKAPTPAQQQIKVGGQAINQDDPKYANLIKQAQQQAPLDLENQPIKIGGQTIDPKDPRYAGLMKQLQSRTQA